MRNSWVINRPIGQPFGIDTAQKSNFLYHNQQQQQQHQQNMDSVSMNNHRDLTINGLPRSSRLQYQPQDRRNKYNTLTPAEAKKIQGFLSTNTATSATNTLQHIRNQPVRTASVLRKPRAPPIIVPPDFLSSQANISRTTVSNGQDEEVYQNLSGVNGGSGARCASSCSNRVNGTTHYRDQRHSINYGQFYNNHTPNIIQNKTSTPNATNAIYSSRASPTDSDTNLSYRSSLDVMDSAYGSDRLQTLSVDLGNPSQLLNNDNNRGMTLTNSYNHNYAKYSKDSHSQDINKLSDDSYSSAKSHQSESNNYNNLKSMSKNSLTSSTSKVFQNQLGNLKKFFRQMPMRRSFLGSTGDQKHKLNLYNHSDTKKQDLSESISQLCLERSQSPPVCPPPPGELKSMSYMETASVNYSNYDEFTKARNQQTSTLLRYGNYRKHANGLTQDNKTTEYSDSQVSPNNNNNINPVDENYWQLQSLPVSYERNLTTVFEEKQNLPDVYRQLNNGENGYSYNFNNNNNNENIQMVSSQILIEPPPKFNDVVKSDQLTINSESTSNNGSSPSTQDSISPSSSSTAECGLDYLRQNASSFRFSYGQPQTYLHDNGKKDGLPPRMPVNKEQNIQTMSNGQSTNSLTNGSNVCDQKTYLPSEQSIKSLCEHSEYGIMNGFGNDGDTTILSDTSTLHGDSTNMVHVNKCAELERTVESLKNKLIAKEKEMTELQLKLWSGDYLISELKSAVGKLEKENAQLKDVVMKFNKSN